MSEVLYLGKSRIEWVSSVKRLGNYVNIYLFIFIHINILWYTSTYSLKSSNNNDDNNNICIYIYRSNDNM